MNKVQYGLEFARFCLSNDVQAVDAARLVSLACKAFKAGARHASVRDAVSADKLLRAMTEFHVTAVPLGFRVVWKTHWPALYKRGHGVLLPSPDSQSSMQGRLTLER